MNAKLFSSWLNSAKPQRSALEKIGLTQKDIEDIQSSFEVKRRAEVKAVDILDINIRELFEEYDPSGIEIGMVRLFEGPQNSSLGWRLGQVEADYLVAEKLSGEIVVEDLTSPGRVIWRCALDGGHFLSAIAIAAKYLAESMVEDKPSEGRQIKALEECVELAGGEAYRPFYRMLLGVF